MPIKTNGIVICIVRHSGSGKMLILISLLCIAYTAFSSQVLRDDDPFSYTIPFPVPPVPKLLKNPILPLVYPKAVPTLPYNSFYHLNKPIRYITNPYPNVVVPNDIFISEYKNRPPRDKFQSLGFNTPNLGKPYRMDVDYSRAPHYYQQLQDAQNLAAELQKDTQLDDPSVLNPKVHFNTLLGVLVALAELKLPVCVNFDAYYDEHYLPTLEQYFVQGITNPNEFPKRIEVISQTIAEKVKNIRTLIESCGGIRLQYCNAWVAYQVNRNPKLYDREANLLEAVAELAESYNSMSSEFHREADQLTELPYLLKSKDAVKDLVKRLLNVVIDVAPNKLTNSCNEF